jgi:hypothetical protein
LAKKGCHGRTDNQSIFDTRNWASKMARCPWVFGKAFSRGFFVQLVAHSAPAANRHIHSLRPIRLIFTAPIDFSARRCERIIRVSAWPISPAGAGLLQAGYFAGVTSLTGVYLDQRGRAAAIIVFDHSCSYTPLIAST